jgi:DNA-binding transcriptional MerR regulator
MTIKDVAAKYGLTEDTLRYYEKEGLIPSVKRTAGGIRNYDEESENWVAFIACMRNAGISIEALQEYVSLFEKGDSTISERKAILERERNNLARKIKEEKAVLDRLDKKIANYESRCLPFEKAKLK